MASMAASASGPMEARISWKEKFSGAGSVGELGLLEWEFRCFLMSGALGAALTRTGWEDVVDCVVGDDLEGGPVVRAFTRWAAA